MCHMEIIEGGDLFSYLDSTVRGESSMSNHSHHHHRVRSMCHCVSVDLNMGAGIATIFKRRFGRVQELKDQQAQIGQVATLYLHDENMYIYYLVTKERYFHVPTYDSLKSSLEAMKTHLSQHNVTELAMPLLGCGLDQLEWDKVQPMIMELFSDMPQLKIIVYKWEKGNEEIKKNAKKSNRKMNDNTIE
ncbi:hypothetical protein C9374_000252 [Naegleria lovaniensis]|uniref:Macro domain-containing protein n=1 Tax=Naegleria lovaniensis TaxID=51637 RepID=A0AA88H045_NAELO|nr:uncharacterized protein C9374_000252 [Naegleria lovaniensis]KAG2388813.1 hypothetical protein C9374_000252 [Naegleria lovaniensis]